jgi:hypothetical protein
VFISIRKISRVMNKMCSFISGSKGHLPCLIFSSKNIRRLVMLKGNYLIFIMFLAIFMLSEAVTSGKSTTWNKTTGGSWTTAGNWTNGVPAANDDVIINSNQSSPITAVPTITLNSLNVSGNCNLKAAANGNTITLTSAFSVSSGITLILGAATGTANLDLTLSSACNGTIDGTVTIYDSSRTFTSSGILTMPQSGIINGTGAFKLSTGATFYVGSTNGITTSGATGNIQVSGTRTYSYWANYIYDGTSAQVTGNGLTQSVPANLTINNSAGVTLSAVTAISDLLSMTSGTLDMANNNLTAGSLTGSANITNSTGTSGTPRIIVGSDGTTPEAYSGVISNGTATSLAVTKIGTGTLILSGSNTFTGQLTIGTGVFQLGASDVLATPPVLLNGGTFSTGSASGYSETLGTLTLSANSIIALGTGSHTLTFAASDETTWTSGTTLTIEGWKGDWDGTGGTEGKVFVGTSSAGLTTSQVEQISFVDDVGASFTATILNTGEVVPKGETPPPPVSDSTIFTNSGTWTAPSCITSVTVEAWGAGGGGSSLTTSGIRGGGGGGGAYASGTVQVTPGHAYNIVVGTGGSGSTAGGKSSFNATTIVAAGGSGGTINSSTGGAGGTVAGSTGLVKYAGGNGGTGGTTFSGGGGGGAGSTGAGGNSPGQLGGTGTTLYGGNGGTGVSGFRNGIPGSTYGGGGSGAASTGGAPRTGGSGANGLVRLTYIHIPPTITLGSNPVVCQGATSANLTYSGTTGCPDQYAINYNSTAKGQGFVDVENTNLPASPITLVVPSSAAPGTYHGTLVVMNSSTGLISTGYPIQITLEANSWIGGTTGALYDWNTASNWSCGFVPTSGTDVIITSSSAYQPVISGTTTAQCRTLTINSGASVTINSTAKATVSIINNNGTLNLNSDASGIASLMVNTYSGSSGKANIQLYLTGGGSPDYNWHYVAVPVDGLSKTYFTDINAYNLLAYDDSRVVSSDFNGWEYHNGYGGTAGIAAGGAFTTMSFGKGYNFYNGSDATVDFANMTSLGTTLGSVSLQYSGSTSGSTIFGYNLLGNSLTCSLDWDKVSFSGWVEQAVYYTTGNKWATYISGGGSTNGATKDIPPLQGFFVKADATGGSVDLSAAKEHSDQVRYKKSANSAKEDNEGIVYPKVKLELNGIETSDETIVWFNNEATTGFDAKYDGHKIFSDAAFGQIYSSIGGIKYSINGIPLPPDLTIVPLGVKITKPGNYYILNKEFVPPVGQNVFLVDKANNNYSVDLKQTEKYTFASDTGTFNDRFILKFVSLATSENDPSMINTKFNIYSTKGFINILPPDDMINASNSIIRIYDLTGRTIKQLTNIELNGKNLIQVPFSGFQGIYIVEINSGPVKCTQKVIVR